MMRENVIKKFEGLLSKEQVLTEEALLQEYATDITGLRMVQKTFWMAI